MPTRRARSRNATQTRRPARATSSWTMSKTSQGQRWRCRAMKTYEGKRTIDGLVVTVDGRRLDEHYEVKRLTRYGFEWTYEGESPQQLALAILYDYVGDAQRAIALSRPFMKEIVANFDNDWTLTGAEIDEFLRARAAA